MNNFKKAALLTAAVLLLSTIAGNVYAGGTLIQLNQYNPTGNLSSTVSGFDKNDFCTLEETISAEDLLTGSVFFFNDGWKPRGFIDNSVVQVPVTTNNETTSINLSFHNVPEGAYRIYINQKVTCDLSDEVYQNHAKYIVVAKKI